MGTLGPRRRDPARRRLSRYLGGTAVVAALLATALLAGCSTPRFDPTGEEASGDPVANKRVGQERRR